MILQESILETPQREPLSPRFGVSRCDDYESLIPPKVEIRVLHGAGCTYTLCQGEDLQQLYEFGTDKSDPAKNAHTLHTRPWTVQVSGMVKKPQMLDIDTIMKCRPIESRVYRHRCVEAWSMVIPWDGYSFSEFISAMEPLPSAKYVQFISDSKNSDMPDKPGGFDWPYSEGLRMDEAMNPLCLLTFGCYGEVLPNQNGAPIRVVSPWKYGFKNSKSIVKIVFTDKQPHTLWNEMAANEYGFYSNVNPQVDHPRWSQAHERRIDSSPFPKTILLQHRLRRDRFYHFKASRKIFLARNSRDLVAETEMPASSATSFTELSLD